MVSLLIAILCSLLIAITLKFSETRHGERSVVIGTNYVVAAVFGVIMAKGFTPATHWMWTVFSIAVGIGRVFGMAIQMHAMKKLGLAITVSVARIASIGPVVGSIIFYGENPSKIQVLGITMGLASFIILGLAQREHHHGDDAHKDLFAIGLLACVFVVIALNDFATKVAQEGEIDKGFFLLLAFTTSAILCWTWAVARRKPLNSRDFILGAFLGVPNFWGSYFAIIALHELGGIVVFPTLSASGVVTATFAAILLWKERPNRRAWVGIILAAFAVVLLG